MTSFVTTPSLAHVTMNRWRSPSVVVDDIITVVTLFSEVSITTTYLGEKIVITDVSTLMTKRNGAH